MSKLAYVSLIAASLAVPSLALAQTAVVTVPSEVETYVVKEKTPSVKVERQVIVGSEIPGTVELRTVPKYDAFSYAVVNDRRVIVDAKTRKVVKIID